MPRDSQLVRVRFEQRLSVVDKGEMEVLGKMGEEIKEGKDKRVKEELGRTPLR
jgi:hypothetical protein